jgi:hypothetical protein
MHQSIKYSIYEAVIIVIVFNDFFLRRSSRNCEY